MVCLRDALTQTPDARLYAPSSARMVTGLQYALPLGVRPQAVHEENLWCGRCGRMEMPTVLA
jgi:hypothetical protein